MRRHRKTIEVRVAVCPDDRNASIALFALMAALLTTMIVVPAVAVLPVVASAALACAALLSLAARAPGFKGRRGLLGDLAGASAFVGVAAAIFSAPTQIVETFALFVQ